MAVFPERRIFDASDQRAFMHSHAHEDLLKFIGAINAAVADKPLSAPCVETPVVERFVAILTLLEGWLVDFPPTPQPMRFGNKAFRSWHARLVSEAHALCTSLTQLLDATPPSDGGSGLSGGGGGVSISSSCADGSPLPPCDTSLELAAYLVDAFGSPSRLDYGTGHETTFILLLYAAARAGLLNARDLPALGLRVFPAYLRVCRGLQRTYVLEPAGSHGVWSLDDYHFLPFLFGSAQLLNHADIPPRSALDASVRAAHGRDYMYLAAIDFIAEVKRGAPFAEHSPMLADAAEGSSWGKVNDGLARLYRAEVLGKLPVAQHFTFGALFPASWQPSRTPVPSESSAALLAAVRAAAGGAGAAAPAPVSSPPGADVVPVDHVSAAVAPWVTAPLCLHTHHTHDSGGAPSSS